MERSDYFCAARRHKNNDIISGCRKAKGFFDSLKACRKADFFGIGTKKRRAGDTQSPVMLFCPASLWPCLRKNETRQCKPHGNLYAGHCLWKGPKRLKGQIKGQAREKRSEALWFQTSCWQREKDSNPHIRSQSPLCYLYTIPLCSDEQRLLYRFSCFCQQLFRRTADFIFPATAEGTATAPWRGNGGHSHPPP